MSDFTIETNEDRLEVIAVDDIQEDFTTMTQIQNRYVHDDGISMAFLDTGSADIPFGIVVMLSLNKQPITKTPSRKLALFKRYDLTNTLLLLYFSRILTLFCELACN
jgi:hypothetical protein